MALYNCHHPIDNQICIRITDLSHSRSDRPCIPDNCIRSSIDHLDTKRIEFHSSALHLDIRNYEFLGTILGFLYIRCIIFLSSIDLLGMCNPSSVDSSIDLEDNLCIGNRSSADLQDIRTCCKLETRFYRTSKLEAEEELEEEEDLDRNHLSHKHFHSI